MTDASGVIHARYDYDPYGRRGVNQITANPVEADYGFTGHYFHSLSGLHLVLFRAYDANTGRWLNRDPLTENGGVNLYAYVYNDPLNLADPDGRWAVAAGLLLLDALLIAQVEVNYEKYFRFTDRERSAAIADNEAAMEGLRNIIASDGERSFEDEGLVVGGTMDTVLCTGARSQDLLNLWESLRNVEGWPSELNELAHRVANHSFKGVPDPNGVQTPDMNVDLAKALLARQEAYDLWLKINL